MKPTIREAVRDCWNALGGLHERRVRVGVVALAMVVMTVGVVTGGEPWWPWMLGYLVLFVAGNIALKWAERRDRERGAR